MTIDEASHLDLWSAYCEAGEWEKPNWKRVHMFRDAHKFNATWRDAGRIYALCDEMHAAGLYENIDHVYGRVRCE